MRNQTNQNIKRTPLSDGNIAKRYVNKIKSSKSRGIEFTLSLTSFKNLMRAKRCYYTGEPLTFRDGPNQLTIDRIDNRKGYVSGNVVACSHKINQLKNTWETMGFDLDLVLTVAQKTKKRS